MSLPLERVHFSKEEVKVRVKPATEENNNMCGNFSGGVLYLHFRLQNAEHVESVGRVDDDPQYLRYNFTGILPGIRVDPVPFLYFEEHSGLADTRHHAI